MAAPLTLQDSRRLGAAKYISTIKTTDQLLNMEGWNGSLQFFHCNYRNITVRVLTLDKYLFSISCLLHQYSPTFNKLV
jgi:hypothetical protein